MFVPSSASVVAGRYELIDEIGRGGMGVVWRARQSNLGVECAVKFIHAAQAHEPEIRRRFVREARAAASLRGPNALHILDVDEWQGTLFIAMELLSGESLEARLSREGSLALPLALDIIEQVARGLNKAHAARIVHRDLKPENIFLTDEEPLLVKILDFGIAKRIDAGSGLDTTSGVLVGTPGYMSPEQAHGGKEIDFRSDLWSLAVVAFRCLTGRAPFEGDGLGQLLVKVMTGPIPAPRSLRPSLPSRVDDWWFRVIQRDPALRPSSATALASGLREALSGASAGGAIAAESARVTGAESLQPTLHPVSSGAARRGRSLFRYAFGAAALLAVLAVVVVLRSGDGATGASAAATVSVSPEGGSSVAAPQVAASTAPAAVPVAPAAAPAPAPEVSVAGTVSIAPAAASVSAASVSAPSVSAPNASAASVLTKPSSPPAKALPNVAPPPPSAAAQPPASAPSAAVSKKLEASKEGPPDQEGPPGEERQEVAPEPDLFRKPVAPVEPRGDDPRLGF